MISVDLHNMRQFIPLPYEAALTPRLRLAHDHLRAGTGAGGEFTGWVRLPEQYDREEFGRIQAAAQKLLRPASREVSSSTVPGVTTRIISRFTRPLAVAGSSVCSQMATL